MISFKLKKIDLFSSLNLRERLWIRSKMKRLRYSNGHVLFREGDSGSLMYVVLRGEVSSTIKTTSGAKLEIIRIPEGGFFGEMEVLDRGDCALTCTVVKDTILLSLSDKEFLEMMKKKPTIAIKIMEKMLNTMASRLQKSGIFLSDMVKWGEEARIRAFTDDMTGLYNKRFFDESLRNTVESSVSTGNPISLIVLDVDKFGILNSEYGKEAGDKILMEIAEVFKDFSGKEDVVSRYGGDEFTFILPGRTGEEALKFSEELNKKIHTMNILDGYDGSIRALSVSLGVAACPLHGKSPEELLKNADQALYAAKEAGRNRVACFHIGTEEKI